MTHFQKTASTMDMDDCALIMDKVRCMERLVRQETIKMNEEITMENTHEWKDWNVICQTRNISMKGSVMTG